MQVPRTPKTISQTRNCITIHVPPLSYHGKNEVVQFFSRGFWECSCKAHYWARKRKQYNSFCSHHHMTTIEPSENAMAIFERFLPIIKAGAGDTSKLWMDVRVCSSPMNYNMNSLYCTKCPMYPGTCNRVLITVKGRKPLIWALQAALLNNRRKDAKEILEKIININKMIKGQ